MNNLYSICRMETVKLDYTAENIRKLTNVLDALKEAGYKADKDNSDLRFSLSKHFFNNKAYFSKYYMSYTFWYHNSALYMDYYISIHK